jgi:hypothetical protein
MRSIPLIVWANDISNYSRNNRRTIDIFGVKTLGLHRLPPKWTPPYFVFPSNLRVRFYRSINGSPQELSDILTDDEKEQILSAIKNLSENGKWQLILRSSANTEGIAHRGTFKSCVTKPELCDVLSGLRSIFSQEGVNDKTKIGVIVQKYIQSTKSIGHLSNERRLSPDHKNWLCEFETTEFDYSPIKIQIDPKEQFLNNLKQSHLECTSFDELSITFRSIAAWSLQAKARMHFEWVWDGNILWLVQADEDTTKVDKGPFSASIDVSSSSRGIQFQVLEAATNIKTGIWQKVDSLKIFQECGLQTVEIWVLHDRKVLSDLQQGRISGKLASDLRKLLFAPIVIRTDISSTNTEDKLFLPHSESISNLRDATSFLVSSYKNQLGLKEVGSNLCYLIHSFIPASSSALCAADPQNDSILVESIWGLPDGLQYCSHDSFKFYKRGKGEIISHIRHKDSIFDVDTEGRWRLRKLGMPWDWRPSLEETEARIIAQGSAKISSYIAKPIHVMWLAGVDSQKKSSCFPWHILSKSSPLTEISLRRQVDTKNLLEIVVKNELDLEKIRNRAVLKNQIMKIINLKPSERLLRSKSFLFNVSKVASELGIQVLLEGSILSHAFYILKRQGVNVVVPELYWDATLDKGDFRINPITRYNTNGKFIK